MAMNVGLSLSPRNIETKLLAPRQDIISFVETSSRLPFNLRSVTRFSRDLILEI